MTIGDTARDGSGATTMADRPARALFAGVVGQDAAVETLRVAARNPVHAYLFTGQPGAGPRAAARGFAAALLCRFGGCGVCRDCTRALAGNHPDVVLVERTGASLSVEDARRLVGLAQRRPFEGDRQVLVVTDVHLAVNSVPALLKTVEEPPPSTIFVLLADGIPPELVTVASRCVEVAFPPVATATIEQWLVADGVEDGLARLAAQSCGGDVDRARLLVDDTGLVDRLALWHSIPARLDGHGAVAGEVSREILAAVDLALAPLRARHAEELRLLGEDAKSLGERGVPGRKDVTDRQHREERRWRSEELRAGLGVLARAYRDQMVADLEAARLDDPQGRRHARGCETAVARITETAASMRRNPNETLLLEGLLVRLSKIGL